MMPLKQLLQVVIIMITIYRKFGSGACWFRVCFIWIWNWESESEPWTLSGSLFQSLEAKCENALPPLVDLDILSAEVQSFVIVLFFF